MRSLSYLGIAAMLMVGGALSAADQFSGLRFADGKSHNYSEYSKQTLIVIHFCNH
jgi:hypothetical protein